jgi:hypothetical protein
MMIVQTMRTREDYQMALYIPTRDQHARYLASGLTRYSYDEITVAAAEVEAAERDLDAAATEATEVVYARAPYGTGWVGWELSLPAHLQDILTLASDCEYASKGSGSEAWPVATWLGIARRNRARAARIRKQITRNSGICRAS